MIRLPRALLPIASSFWLIGAAPAGMYARHAEPVWDRVMPEGALRLVSPDRRTQIVARYSENEGDDGHVTLVVRGALGHGRVRLGPGVGSEVLWSPDSRAFAVTTSDGGGNGLYRTLVVAGGQRGLLVHDLTPLVQRAFGHPVRCGWREPPNVGAVRWQGGTARLLVAAEIVAHSNCDSFGTFRVYEIDWRAGRITRRYDQLDAKRRYANSLGQELRAAPDLCVRVPRRCWVSTNHPRPAR